MVNGRKPGSLLTASIVASVALAGAACNRGEDKAGAAAEKQAVSPVQQVNQPTIVVGCLRAGEASDTFMLTAEKSQTGEPPTTYHLVGSGAANLTELIGQQVQVTGKVEAQQQVATRTTTDPAPGATTGTSGTPAVSTATKLDIKRLEVERVQPLGGECKE
jgi:hypothetical protein